MTNIWRYSLIFAFTIILDQLIKGTIQGFLGSQEVVEVFSGLIIQEIKTPPSELWLNRCLYLSSLLGLVYMIRNTILYRNKNFLLGLFRTFIMIGLFTTFLDFSTTGYFVDYIYLLGVPLSFGKILFVVGLMFLLISKLKRLRQ
jgi:hypothetical protein